MQARSYLKTKEEEEEASNAGQVILEDPSPALQQQLYDPGVSPLSRGVQGRLTRPVRIIQDGAAPPYPPSQPNPSRTTPLTVNQPQASVVPAMSAPSQYQRVCTITEHHRRVYNIIEHYPRVCNITEHYRRVRNITEHHRRVCNIKEDYHRLRT